MTEGRGEEDENSDLDLLAVLRGRKRRDSSGALGMTKGGEE